MFRKEGLKKMALSCILTFTLALGAASIGYCGGGAGEGGIPEGFSSLTGPAIIGHLTLDCGNNTMAFDGRCKQIPVELATVNFPQACEVEDENQDPERVTRRTLQGSTLDLVVPEGCYDEFGGQFKLVIEGVMSFSDDLFDDVIEAGVVVLKVND